MAVIDVAIVMSFAGAILLWIIGIVADGGA